MESQKKKCSFKEHKEIDALNYCQECQIYMCNKCSNYHKGLLESHHLYNAGEKIEDIFTGYCNEKGHPNKLIYFCKTHNKLCCAACIAKINEKGDGQHKECKVCVIENIVEEKKNKLKDNINSLETLSNELEKSIEQLKNLFQNIKDNKEELILKTQKIFTNIRNKLNEREDQILQEIDDQFTSLYCDEKTIKEFENLPHIIKKSLEKGKKIDNNWENNDNINSLINDCVNIENNIASINTINKNIKRFKTNTSIKIKFFPEERGINELLKTIKAFGKIYYNRFIFRKCPINIDQREKYTITGDNKNIITKIGNECWISILGENELEKNKEHKWKIKIIKNYYNRIRIGIVPNDFDINSSDNYSCGWCFYCFDSCLYSGPPLNYNGKSTNLSKIKNEIVIVLNMIKGTMKFIIDNEDKGESYSNIPLDKSFVPVIFLYDINDSVEVTNY